MHRSKRLHADARHPPVQRLVDHLSARYLPTRAVVERGRSNQPACLRLLRDGGTTLMSTRLSAWLNQLKQIGGRRESGQIIVLFAVFVIVLMVLAGSAYDYASIVTDDARLQNSVDAAALAGSNTLSQNAGLPVGTPVAMAQATANAYLANNGVATSTPGTTITMTFPTSTPVGANPASPIIENLTLSVTRNHPNA